MTSAFGERFTDNRAGNPAPSSPATPNGAATGAAVAAARSSSTENHR